MRRKFTLKMGVFLLSFLFVNTFLYGQVNVFTENFETTSNPDSTTSVGTASWAKSSMVQMGGTYSDSCSLVNPGDTSVLTTDAFSTTGKSFVLLKFAHICKIEFPDAATVEVSSDNGVTWTTLTFVHYKGAYQTFNQTGRFMVGAYPEWLPGQAAIPDNTWWKEEIFDISTLVSNASQVKVRFVLKDKNNSAIANDNYAWFLDDIRVEAAIDELYPPTITLENPILKDSVYTTGPFSIRASITDPSGIDTAYIEYQINSGATLSTGMTEGTNNLYNGIITKTAGFVIGDTIRYRVVSIDNSASQNMAHNPTTGWQEFVIYTLPLPSNCTTPIVVFPFIEDFETFNASNNTLLNGWTQGTGTFKWEVGRYATSANSGSTGPNTDNTTKSDTGTYVYTEATSGSSGDVTTMVSPCLNIKNLTIPQLSFFYHMFGSATGELHVDIYYGGKWVLDIAPAIIGQQQTSESDSWTQVNVDLTNYKSICKIRFRGIKGSSYEGDISIDDIRIYDPFTYDIGVSSFQAPTDLTYAGSKDVKVEISNYGAAVLTSATINWSVNGALQTPFAWTGSINSLQSEDSITIGSYTYTTGVQEVIAWTSSPNGNTDQNHANDTSRISTFVCASALSGTYTVGSATSNYPTLSEAITALNMCGVSGPVTMQILPGTYTGNIELATIPGASSTNIVTFQSSTNDSADVIIEAQMNTLNANVIRLNGTQYVSFKNLTIHGIEDGEMEVIRLLDNTQHITFEGNHIYSSFGSAYDFRIVYSNTGIQNITFLNNKIQGGYYGLDFLGNSTNRSHSITIQGNEISNYKYYGIRMKYTDTAEISNNNLTSTLAYYHINVEYINSPLRISKNQIRGDRSSYTYGIDLYKNVGTSTNPILVDNNFIYLGGSSSSHRGIMDDQNIYVDYVYNTVNIYQGNSSSAALYLYKNYSTGVSSNLNILNNTFCNATTGYATYFGDTNSTINSNYNNVYSPYGNIAKCGGIYTSLSALQTATGWDMNSISIEPLLVGSNYQMAIVQANDKGTPFTSVTTDIDGDTRNASTPDIGCDEFELPPFDAGIESFVTPTTQDTQYYSNPIIVKLRNYGSDTLKALQISYMINGGTATNFAWTGKLDPSTSENVTLPNYTVPSGDFEITVFTTLATDMNTQNDTASISIFGWPKQSLEVTSFVSPSNGCGLGVEDIKVEITNIGYDTIKGGVSTAYKLNDAAYNSAETISSDILPGATYVHTFATNEDLTTLVKDSTFKFEIYALIAGDPVTSDDTLEVNVESKYKPTSPSINDTTVYHGTSVDLLALANDPIKWYSTATSTYTLKTGSAYTTPVLTDTADYFLEATSTTGCISDRIQMFVNVLDKPAIDAELASIDIVDGCGLDNEPVNIDIYNYGTDSIKGNIQVSYKIDNGAWTAFESINDTIVPGATFTYTFNTLALLNAPNKDTSYVITAVVNNTNDPNHYNDSLVSGTFDSKFTPDLPVVSDISVTYNTTGNFTSTFNGNVYWYNSANAQNHLIQGSSFTTPVLYGTTSYWVEEENTSNNCRSQKKEVVATVTSIPATDLGISAIVSNSGCQLSNAESITIDIYNLGTQTTNTAVTANFKIAANAYGTPETVNVTIPAQDTISYTFTNLANLYYGIDSIIDIEAYVSYATDTYNTNDTLASTIASNFTPPTPTATDAMVVFGNTATLNATSTFNMNWYNDVALNNQVGTGATYVTPLVYSNTDYYVTAQSNTPGFVEVISGGTGSTNSAPVYGYFEYTWNHSVYTKSEIGEPLIIDTLAFYVVNAANWTMPKQRIFLGTVTDSILTTSQPDTLNGYQLVFNDTIVWQQGWNKIALSTPYAYSGAEHLAIYWENRQGGSVGYNDPYPKFRYINGTFFRNVYKGSTSSFPTTTTGSRNKYLADVQFIGRIGGCESPAKTVNVNHHPLPPVDLKILDIAVNSGCGLTNEQVTITYVQEGSDSLKGNYTAKFQIDAHTFSALETITDTIVFGDTLTYTFNTLANLSTVKDTLFSITAIMNHANDANNNNDTLLLDSIASFYTPAVPTFTTPISVAYGSQANLSVSSSDSIRWFAGQNDAHSFHNGLNYTTPVLYDTTSYWVEASAGKDILILTEICQYPTGTGQTPTYPSYFPSGGAWDMVEITNIGDGVADLSQYTLNFEGDLNGSFTFPTGAVLGAGEIALVNYGTGSVTDLANHIYTANVSPLMSSDDAGYYITDQNGDIVDAVGTNSYTFTTTSGVTSSDWSGNVATASSKAGIIRVSDDTDNASDWAVSTTSLTQTLGSFNPSITTGSGSGCSSQRVEMVIETGVKPNEDASIYAVVDLGTNLCSGSYNVEALVKNFGADTIETLDLVYSLNGNAAVSNSISGLTILSDSVSNSIAIGNINLSAGINILKVWTNLPNGIADASNLNDTLYTDIYVSLSGALSLGTPSSDFADFNTLFAVLDSVGICGPTEINIADGTYNFHYSIGEIKGASAINTFTLQSASADTALVTLQYAATSTADNYVLKLDGTDYFTLNQLTLKSTGIGNYGKIIHLLNNATYNTISNNRIQSLFNSSSYSYAIHSDAIKESYNTYTNNYILNGSYGLYIKGSSSVNSDKGVVVANNTIDDFYTTGLYLYYMDTCTIENNSIVKSNITGYSTQYGIYVYYSDNYKMIRNNTISIQTSATGTVYGLYLYYSQGTATSKHIVYNNMISLDHSGTEYGVKAYGAEFLDFYYNTIVTNDNGSLSKTVYVDGSTGNDITILNNNMVNKGSGIPYYVSYPNTLLNSDYNNLYSAGSNLAYWSGNHTSLGSLIASSAMDAHSINVNPSFYSNTDLHTSELSLNGAATPIPSITSDIDGNMRNATTPDIGADEFTPSSVDAGAVALVTPFGTGCYSSAEEVKIQIRNHGSAVLDFATNPIYINVIVSGAVSQTIPTVTLNTGTLGIGAFMDVSVTTTFDMTTPGYYTFNASTSITADTILSNNTMASASILSSMVTDIFPTTENFETFTVGNPGVLDHGWSTDNSIFNWAVGTGTTPTSSTGPNGGHDANSLNYLYTESSNGSTNDTARMYSNCLDFTAHSNVAMSFWYHKYGSSMGDLIVEALDNTTNTWIGLDTISGETHTATATPWSKQIVDLSSVAGQVSRIRFSGIKGSGINGDMAIDDVKFFVPVAKDAGIKEFIQPAINYAQAGSLVNVELVIENFGYDTLKSIPVAIAYNGNVVTTGTWIGTLPPYDTTSFTLTSPIQTLPGLKKLKAYTILPNDALASNDTCTRDFLGIKTFVPDYANDFEGTQEFATDLNSVWQRGIPTASIINSAYSPDQVWTTNLSGDYGKNENDYLYTPFYDLSSLSSVDTATLSFHHYMDMELNSDYGNIEYSVDNALSWTVLGIQNDPLGSNWYTHTGTGTQYFSLVDSGWVNSTYKLNPLTFNVSNSVQFRFKFVSDGSVNKNGWAIDNFEINLPVVANNVAMLEIVSPANSTPAGDNISVSIKFVNKGNNTLNSVPVAYRVNNLPAVTATWTGVSNPGDTSAYTFTTPYTSPAIDYDFCAYTNLAVDPFRGNDTICKTVIADKALFDVGVTQIINPIGTLHIGGDSSVTIRVMNLGLSTITSIPLEYTVGVKTVQETWTGNLAPGSFVDYTFTATFMVQVGNFQLCARTVLANDAVTSNDEICKTLSGIVGIHETDLEGFYIRQNRPNPANHTTHVDFTVPNNGDVHFEIVNMLGQTLLRKDMKAKQGFNSIPVDVSSLQAGLYHYVVIYDGHRRSKTMAITK